MSHGCGCGQSNNPRRRCGTCNECNPNDLLDICQAGQIEQLKKRTDQLKAQLECLNQGEPYDALCPVQTCKLPKCPPYSGTICENESPTGRPVGATPGSGCSEPNTSSDCCDALLAKYRTLDQKVTQQGRETCQIMNEAIGEVLLDNTGQVRGGVTLNGDLVNFTIGSWELFLASQEDC